MADKNNGGQAHNPLAALLKTDRNESMWQGIPLIAEYVGYIGSSSVSLFYIALRVV